MKSVAIPASLVGAVLALLLLCAPALAEEGSLDPSFGDAGRMTFDQPYPPMPPTQSVATDSHGRILLGGSAYNGQDEDFALTRLRPDGSLDSSFGDGGRVLTPIGTSNDRGTSIAIDSQGRIVLGGSGIVGTSWDFAVARYLSDGSLDVSFGGDGIVNTVMGAGKQDFIRSIAIDSQGRIVAAGRSFTGGGSPGGVLASIARYLPDGSLDSSFDGDGMQTTPVGNSEDPARSVAIDAQDRILLGGGLSNGTDIDFALERLLPDGSPDSSFDGDGRLTTPIGAADDIINSVAFDSSGRIVAGGKGAGNFALARYMPDGSPDSSFDGDGRLTTEMGSRDGDYATSIAFDSRGRIVAGGEYFGLARYLPGGSLDPDFGHGGATWTGFYHADDPSDPPTIDHLLSIAIDGQDRIVAGGTGLARFIGDETTTIDSGPIDGSAVNEVSPDFAFSSSKPGSSFECRFDGGGWSSCASPQQPGPLSEGEHAFAVRSTDPLDETDPTPASAAFTVDITAPETTIDSFSISRGTVKVNFSTSESDVDFECRSDNAGWYACAPADRPHFYPGPHTFEVRAVDRAGNIDPTPDARSFTIAPYPGRCINAQFLPTAGDDLVIGTPFGDEMRGLAGNDTMLGRNGRDCLDGGPGADRIRGDKREDKLTGGSGADRLWGNKGNDFLDGGSGADRIWGNEGNDFLDGGSGADRIWGNGGSDQLFGGSGPDRIYARDGVRDRINCGAGTDWVRVDANDDLDPGCERGVPKSLRAGSCFGHQATIVASRGARVVHGTRHRDVIVGRRGGQRILGGGGNDLICGGPDDDSIRGQDGNDKIHSGDGDDTVYGGRGNDLLCADGGGDTVYAGPGNDLIVGGARIYLGSGKDIAYGDSGPGC